MSVNAILDMDIEVFNMLSEKTLRQLTTQLDSAANKRLFYLEKKGLAEKSPAYRSRKGQRFSVKNKNLNQLRAAFMEVKNFLENETSTARGVKKYWENIHKKLKEKGIDIPLDKISEFFDYYMKLTEISPISGLPEFRYKAMEIITEIIIEKNNELTIEEIYTKWRNYIARENIKYGAPSDFGLMW